MRVRSTLKLLQALPGGVPRTPAGAQPVSPPTCRCGPRPERRDRRLPSARHHSRRRSRSTESAKHLGRMEQSPAAFADARGSAQAARRRQDDLPQRQLSQIDVAIRSGRDRRTQLQAAVNRNDAELANHEFTILTVLRQRSEHWSPKPTKCIG